MQVIPRWLQRQLNVVPYVSNLLFEGDARKKSEIKPMKPHFAYPTANVDVIYNPSTKGDRYRVRIHPAGCSEHKYAFACDTLDKVLGHLVDKHMTEFPNLKVTSYVPPSHLQNVPDSYSLQRPKKHESQHQNDGDEIMVAVINKVLNPRQISVTDITEVMKLDKGLYLEPHKAISVVDAQKLFPRN